MSDHDRGAYTPPSDRLAFDPREPVRGGPAPVTLIASALVLLVMIGAVVFFYRHGFRHSGPPAVVGAPVADIKTAAPPPADNAAAEVSGLTIDKTNAVAFAPPPEQPQARPLAAPATPIASLPAAPPVVIATNSAQALRPAKPLTIASLADAAVAGPSPKPAAKAAVVKPAPKPEAQAAAAAAAPVGAGWIQIGAYSSAALADKGWDDVARLAPDQMAGKGKRVQLVTVGGKTLYRAFVTGFYSPAAAGAFCDDLKGAGRPCIVR